MKILMIDNYDSFTYNLVHLIESISGLPVTVWRNDQFELSAAQLFHKIILSPGPGLPNDAGLMPALLKTYGSSKSILGVCLGLQAIAQCFGGELHNLTHVYHGVATPIYVLDSSTPLFKNVPTPFLGGRYHSWAVTKASLPKDMEVTAEDDQHQIMALRHKVYDVQGVQFHPESYLSRSVGPTIIKNWLYAS